MSTVIIDYESMPSDADKIRSLAQEVDNKLLDAYKNAAEMHVCWYGKRYNELITNFNNVATVLNQYLNAVVAEIPYMFDRIANEISNVDIQQNVTTARKDEFQKIQEIQIINDVGMRYLQNEVVNYQTNIEADFSSAKEYMTSMQKIVDEMQLECDGSDEFRRQFKKFVESFKQVLNNVQTSFTKLMNQDREEMENAEKANTIK